MNEQANGDPDPRPCLGRNANVCVAEGCYGEACVRSAKADYSTEAWGRRAIALFCPGCRDRDALHACDHAPRRYAAPSKEQAPKIPTSHGCWWLCRLVNGCQR